MESEKLNADDVHNVFIACGRGLGEMIKVDGILRHGVLLSKEQLAKNKDTIGGWIKELPTEFLTSGGGGWSFLNLCNDKAGRQWTGLHSTMEELCMLAIAVGLAKWLLPREMWDALPGGMPYVGFELPGA